MLLRRIRSLTAALATAALASACADAPASAPAGALLSSGPNLLECPINTTESTAGVVGPLGGLLSLGNYAVSFPAGAVATPTLFTITVPASRFMQLDVTAAGVEHFLFDAPVSVTVDYSRCPAGRTEGRDLSVWYVAPITNTPLQDMGGTDDPAARKITFTTDHLSSYVIAY